MVGAPTAGPDAVPVSAPDVTADETNLADLNQRFISACRLGSWEQLSLVLSDQFVYVDGLTGDRWEMSRYIEDLRANPSPNLGVDQVVVHVAGDTGSVTARSSNGSGRFNRYVDVYAREQDGWKCVQACVWPLPGAQ
jgi:hypothetical protein